MTGRAKPGRGARRWSQKEARPPEAPESQPRRDRVAEPAGAARRIAAAPLTASSSTSFQTLTAKPDAKTQTAPSSVGVWGFSSLLYSTPAHKTNGAVGPCGTANPATYFQNPVGLSDALVG